MPNIDFAEGVNVKQFILGMESVFLHEIYNCALPLSKEDNSRVSGAAAILAGSVGNYYLILNCMRGRMPSLEGEQLLEELVSDMGVLVEKGLTFEADKREFVVLADKMSDSYSELKKYMKAQPN